MTSPAGDAPRPTSTTGASSPPALPPLQPSTVLPIPTVTSVVQRNAAGLAALVDAPSSTATQAPQIIVRSVSPAAASAPPAQAFSLIPAIDDKEIDIKEKIGQGSSGGVYLGIWDQEAVALKQLAFDEPEMLEWEVNRMASINHPNVVRFHGLCRKNGGTYLVMELCEQGSMQSALKRGGISSARQWQWMLEITQGLAHLHAHGILHRDLKAENVLIDRHGRAKLADLGVAQVDALLEQTESADVNGGIQTPAFIAPENRDRSKGQHRMSSKATDIYALGLVFWQMVSQGAIPTLWSDVLAEDPDLLQTAAGTRPRMPIPPACPAAIKELILSCWRLDPTERATIEQVLEQLRRMEVHPEHALVSLAQHMQQTMHEQNEYACNYMQSLAIRHPLKESKEDYLARWEEHSNAAATSPDLSSTEPVAPTRTNQFVLNINSSNSAPITSTFSNAATSSMQYSPTAYPSAVDTLLERWIARKKENISLFYRYFEKWLPGRATKRSFISDIFIIVHSIRKQRARDRAGSNLPPTQQSSSRSTTLPANSQITSMPAKAIPGKMNPPSALTEVIEVFLQDSDLKTLVLLGEAGVGKTLSAHVQAERILQKWWRHFSDPTKWPKPEWMPIVIRPHVSNSNHPNVQEAFSNIVSQHRLERNGVKFLVIVDGYDEFRTDPDCSANLAKNLNLRPGDKLIVTCRPDAISEDEWSTHFGFAKERQVHHLLPFTRQQVHDYLKKHLERDKSTARDFERRLLESPKFESALRNPFVLYSLQQGWSRISKLHSHQLTRSRIYAEFISHVVETGIGKLGSEIQNVIQAGHKSVTDSFLTFAGQIAFLACKERKSTLPIAAAKEILPPWSKLTDIVIQNARNRFIERRSLYEKLNDQKARTEMRRRDVLTEKDFVQIFLNAVTGIVSRLPLRSHGEHYEFIHKSLFEFCAAWKLLRFLGDEAESVVEKDFQALLTWAGKNFSEILIFVHEITLLSAQEVHMEAIVSFARPSGRRGQRNTAWLLSAIGKALNKRNRNEDALAYHISALKIWEQLIDPSNRPAEVPMRSDGAMPADEQTASQWAGRLQDEHGDTMERELRQNASITEFYSRYGQEMKSQHRYAEAELLFRSAIKLQKQTLGKDHVNTAESFWELGLVLNEQGKHGDALKFCRKALQVFKRVSHNNVILYQKIVASWENQSTGGKG